MQVDTLYMANVERIYESENQEGRSESDETPFFVQLWPLNAVFHWRRKFLINSIVERRSQRRRSTSAVSWLGLLTFARD